MAASDCLAPKRVVFLAQDVKNGGVVGAFRSFQEASAELGWSVSLINLRGSKPQLRDQFRKLVGGQADGVVLGGIDEREVADLVHPVLPPGTAETAVVGWHASERPGPGRVVFANVTTEPGTVAEMAVNYLLRTVSGRAGVVLFNDSRFAIANLKTQRMLKELQRCEVCEVLSVEDIPISEAGDRMAAALQRLEARWGSRWTHVLSINDVYLDSINFPAALIGRSDLIGIAAGDGSRTALTRIRTGRAKQVATVAEPIGFQGWQLADELVHAFAGKAPSGNVSKPVLVTAQMLDAHPNFELLAEEREKAAFRQRWHLGVGRPPCDSASAGKR